MNRQCIVGLALAAVLNAGGAEERRLRTRQSRSMKCLPGSSVGCWRMQREVDPDYWTGRMYGGLTGYERKFSDSTMRGMVIEGRRYLPAAPAEVAFKLSRLAWNLRQEAARWGHPCLDSGTGRAKP